MGSQNNNNQQNTSIDNNDKATKGLFSDHPLVNKGEPPKSLSDSANQSLNQSSNQNSIPSKEHTKPQTSVATNTATTKLQETTPPKTSNSIADFLKSRLTSTPAKTNQSNRTDTASVSTASQNTSSDIDQPADVIADIDDINNTNTNTAIRHDDTHHSLSNNPKQTGNSNSNFNSKPASNDSQVKHPNLDQRRAVNQTTNQTKHLKTTVAQGEPLKLAVVGHTNTGKTSILRTLLRDMYFGEVKNEAATTRHVERAIISDSMTGEAMVSLYDTPGLEDASGLMDWLEDNTASRRDGIERLQQFLANPIASSTHDKRASHADSEISHYDDYSQEAKVIRQLLASDMAIYVIDAREPVLGKYKDELTILSWAAIPIMPVFNFSATEHGNINDWQTMLARRNLHISTRFDSVAFEFEDEMTLWQNLATMLTHSEMLDTLIVRRRDDWLQLYEEATVIIADFLLNIAAYVREVDEDEDSLPVLKEMQEAVRQTERAMQSKLLNLYKFYDNTAVATPLKLSEYQQDPFDPELLKSYGLRTTSGAAAGALLGLGIDAAALGTTLGLGAALGGIAGGLLSNTSSIADKITGVKRLFIDPTTLTLLATRSLDLLASLRHRGHAAQPDSVISELQAVTNPPWSPTKLPSELKKAHSRAHWSSLNGADSVQAANLRYEAAFSLSTKLVRTTKLSD